MLSRALCLAWLRWQVCGLWLSPWKVMKRCERRFHLWGSVSGGKQKHLQQQQWKRQWQRQWQREAVTTAQRQWQNNCKHFHYSYTKCRWCSHCFFSSRKALHCLWMSHLSLLEASYMFILLAALGKKISSKLIVFSKKNLHSQHFFWLIFSARFLLTAIDFGFRDIMPQLSRNVFFDFGSAFLVSVFSLILTSW